MTYEEALARVLRAADPGDELKAVLAEELPAELRWALAAIDPDGLRLAALQVARMRFERVVQGSAEAAAWFDADPRGFTAAFKRYHLEVPPAGVLARDEGAAFDASTSLAKRRASET